MSSFTCCLSKSSTVKETDLYAVSRCHQSRKWRCSHWRWLSDPHLSSLSFITQSVCLVALLCCICATLFSSHLCFTGTECPICLTRAQKQVLSGAPDASSLPKPVCLVGQCQLLFSLPGPFPYHLAGVCTFCQSEKGCFRLPTTPLWHCVKKFP